MVKRKIRIGLIGFGKTGKAVASVLLQNKDFRLDWVLRRKKNLSMRSASEFLGIDSPDPGMIYSTETMPVRELLDKHPIDIIIDFSSTDGIYTYGKQAAEKGIKIISAISHYSDKEKRYLKMLAGQTTVFWSPNITLGVNYLMFASRYLKKIAPWVDIEIVEEHFKGKEGISGTAMKIAGALELEQGQINSIRVGGIVGKHEVIFGFPHQVVRISHESISREAFGNGVVFVSKNILEKDKGYYVFEDILAPFFAMSA